MKKFFAYLLSFALLASCGGETFRLVPPAVLTSIQATFGVVPRTVSIICRNIMTLVTKSLTSTIMTESSGGPFLYLRDIESAVGKIGVECLHHRREA